MENKENNIEREKSAQELIDEEYDKRLANVEKKVKLKYLGTFIANTCLYLSLFICLFAVTATVAIKKDTDGAMTVFGYQFRIVISDSMAKCDQTYDSIKQYKIKDIPLKSLVIVKVMPEDEKEADKWYESLKKGDVLTFRYTYTRQETITHRIDDIYKKKDGSGWIIILKGDNRASENSDTLEQIIDTSIPNSTNYVIGKVVDTNYLFGSLLTFIKKPAGIVVLVIAPCLIIIFLEIIKLINYFGKEKKDKLESENEKNRNEIEELKKKLAELEQTKTQENKQNSNDVQNEENLSESVSKDATQLALNDEKTEEVENNEIVKEENISEKEENESKEEIKTEDTVGEEKQLNESENVKENVEDNSEEKTTNPSKSKTETRRTTSKSTQQKNSQKSSNKTGNSGQKSRKTTNNVKK